MQRIKLKIATSIIFILSSCILFAQNPPNKNIRVTLSGKITAAQANTPLQAASVYIPDLKTGTTTDENGNYTLRNLPA